MGNPSTILIVEVSNDGRKITGQLYVIDFAKMI